MARKAIVDREIVLQLLHEGKTSQAIANQYGVSRQAIDLYRKQFVQDGVLQRSRTTRPATTVKPKPNNKPIHHQTAEPSPELKGQAYLFTPPLQATITVPVDQIVDLVYQAFTALKRIPELEAEITEIRKNYESALQQIEQLKDREQKRQEQEARWIHAQSPGIMTDR